MTSPVVLLRLVLLPPTDVFFLYVFYLFISQAQGICPTEEWTTFMDCLKTTLPGNSVL